MQLTADFGHVLEGGYVAFVEELPGPNTQGTTLDEGRENLREAVASLASLLAACSCQKTQCTGI